MSRVLDALFGRGPELPPPAPSWPWTVVDDLDEERLARALRIIHGDEVPLPNRCTPREYAAVIARWYRDADSYRGPVG